MSATHSRSGPAVVNCRSTRSGVGGAVSSRIVVRTFRRLTPGSCAVRNQAGDTLAADVDALSRQFGMDPWRAIRPPRLPVDPRDQGTQLHIGPPVRPSRPAAAG